MFFTLIYQKNQNIAELYRRKPKGKAVTLETLAEWMKNELTLRSKSSGETISCIQENRSLFTIIPKFSLYNAPEDWVNDQFGEIKSNPGEMINEKEE